MSHHIYNTKCFIIDSSPSGESDKIINIYTEDFGLIRSVAKGVREMKSKLRYSLQEATYGTVALVRGREIWRVTNASKEISLFNRGLNPSGRRALASLLKFVARFAPGEGKNSDIFEILKTVSGFVFRNHLKTEEVEIIELIARIRIMNELGYIKNDDNHAPSNLGPLNPILLTDPLSSENFEKWKTDHKKIQEILDDAIVQSHL